MKNTYLKKADDNLPGLFEQMIVPAKEGFTLSQSDTIVLDLGSHRVGYFSFCMNYVSTYIDAPVRLKIRFCEHIRELDDPYEDYHGTLCSSWLQEEIINLDFPIRYDLKRRYAARYIKITVLAAPKPLLLYGFEFRAVTSADEAKIKPLSCSDPLLCEIDKVASITLRDCMQRVFEDGPKRDRRLWTGDLRLEALANYATYGKTDIVKRCLYLFAASDRNKYGFLSSFVYEDPVFASGDANIIDYAMMFVVTLCDLYTHTGDRDTFIDLLPVAKEQLSCACNMLDEYGIMQAPEDWWSAFIDWCPELVKVTSLHGIYLYTLDKFASCLDSILPAEAEKYRALLAKGRAAAATHLFDEKSGKVKSSRICTDPAVHSAVWMILGGVVTGNKGLELLEQALNDKNAKKPGTPYMHHYVAESYIALGRYDLAGEYIKKIWGGMLKLYKDAFSEVYMENDPDFSPYNDRMVNSMCHAWSCTPSYFIRNYLCPSQS